MSYPLMIESCQTICADMTPSVLRPSKWVRNYFKNLLEKRRNLKENHCQANPPPKNGRL